MIAQRLPLAALAAVVIAYVAAAVVIFGFHRHNSTAIIVVGLLGIFATIAAVFAIIKDQQRPSPQTRITAALAILSGHRHPSSASPSPSSPAKEADVEHSPQMTVTEGGAPPVSAPAEPAAVTGLLSASPAPGAKAPASEVGALTATLAAAADQGHAAVGNEPALVQAAVIDVARALLGRFPSAEHALAAVLVAQQRGFLENLKLI